MKQIIQNIKDGKTILEEIPTPSIDSNSVLIKTTHSLISLGTEKMLVDFGKASYIQKARQQPEKVKIVLDKMKTDGVLPTLEAVFNKLDQPIPMGYCNVGIVEDIGKNVTNLNVGDRVASNGNHAEFVSVPQNLVAKIPDNVTNEQATFTVIGSIGLQGIRLLKPTFGETIVVFGLGLVGMITAELLVANGCNVVGFDFNSEKIKIAQSKGITAINSSGLDTEQYIRNLTNNNGSDGVIITASSKSNEIISQSAKMCRRGGRIILVGVIGLNIARADFYEKEISFQVSCSYGPGRYDTNYEEKGQDYPIGYVRWTEKRNFEALLYSLSKKQIDVEPLITNKIQLENFLDIYDNMNNKNAIASILVYNKESMATTTIKIDTKSFTGTEGNVGIIGAGNFTSSTILPILKKLNYKINYISSSRGLSSTVLAKKYGIEQSTTDYKEILKDQKTDLVFITTRHNSHAKLIIESIISKKNVFVEKPLCINKDELDEIVDCYNQNKQSISVGFNRRFSPISKKAKELLSSTSNILNINLTCNAGFIPKDSWVHDMEIGGGRVIGEICHFIDLCSYFTNSLVSKVCMSSLGPESKLNTDNVSLLLKYQNGSNVTINYFSNGSKSFSKEKVEIFSDNKVLIIDNWRKLTGYGFKNFSKYKAKQDKGHFNQFKKLLNYQLNNGKPIIPFDEVLNTTQVTISALESLIKNRWINILND